MSVQPQANQPRHAELAEVLAAEILSGRYPVGSRFPTEHELRAQFGVGRHTIREALKTLTEQGLLGRRRKTGTIVLADRPVSRYVHSLRDLMGLLAFAQGTILDVQHIGFISKRELGPDNISELPDTRWLRIAGIRSTRTNGKPLCWSEILVPERFAPAREKLRHTDRAIYDHVMQENELRLDYVEQDITATELPPSLAVLLKAEPNTAALLVKRCYVSHNGATFEISRNLYPAGRYSVRSVIRQRS